MSEPASDDAPVTVPGPLPFPSLIEVRLPFQRTLIAVDDDGGELATRARYAYATAAIGDAEAFSKPGEMVGITNEIVIGHVAINGEPVEAREETLRSWILEMMERDVAEVLGLGSWLHQAVSTIRPSPCDPGEGLTAEELAAVVMWLTPDEVERVVAATRCAGRDGAALSKAVRALAMLGARHATAETLPPPPVGERESGRFSETTIAPVESIRFEPTAAYQPSPVTIETCARAAYEANRAYREAIGEARLAHWEDAPAHRKNRVRSGVRNALNWSTARANHFAWLAYLTAEGWTHGPTEDPEAKTHPNLVPFDELPDQQRAKDTLFVTVVRATARALGQLPDPPLGYVEE